MIKYKRDRMSTLAGWALLVACAAIALNAVGWLESAESYDRYRFCLEEVPAGQLELLGWEYFETKCSFKTGYKGDE